MQTSKSIDTVFTVNAFWQSVNILITKPHVVNKRLWGSKIWFNHNYVSSCFSWDLQSKCYPLKDIITDENIKLMSNDILRQLKLCLFDDETDGVDAAIEIILIELLPKAYTDNQAYQLVCLQKDKATVTFYNVTPVSLTQNLCPDYTFKLQLDGHKVVLAASGGYNSSSYVWLTNMLLPQFVKWGTESLLSEMTTICSESLSLVSQTKYYKKYNELKLKYGKEMVKIWPECTDPSKFVYEDVAIAAYLLLIWEQNDTKMKTFVDLGCGNGLLVYILVQEGHSGVGLDVRKRHIWDMFPPNVILQEKTFTPSDTALFPDADWVIGNHSDELTPWIPVIAAKSSYKCNFFLLPCCAYNFDGSKYQRKNSFKSQYIDYLEYIKELCKDCGFNVDTDRLKIPSTKRICLVSSGRVYSGEDYQNYRDKIDDLINCGSCVTNNFKPRNPVERVRNCTQVDKNVISAIVSCITKHLLKNCSDTNSSWSLGQLTDINELVKLIPNEHLKILKSECGGLQTLLKNNHHIFKVQNGKVELRHPKTIEEVSSNMKKRRSNQAIMKVQVKPCWFYNNHPQGCPLQDTSCSFLHVKHK